MPNRTYKSSQREEAAAATRARIVAATSDLLRDAKNSAALSMEGVAKAAGVTRLTVYNQFGGRAALLEAVFDERAAQGGLMRIPEAMRMDDPQAALLRLVEIFCGFWGSDPGLGGLHDQAGLDPEFAAALSERNERRRNAIAALVDRMKFKSRDKRDLIDTLFVLTSQAVYRNLASSGRSEKATYALLARLCEATIAAYR